MNHQIDGGFEGGKNMKNKNWREDWGVNLGDLYFLLGRGILKRNKVVDWKVGGPEEWSFVEARRKRLINPAYTDICLSRD